MNCSSIGVKVAPGETQLTRTSGASSAASCRVRPSRPAFEAPYAAALCRPGERSDRRDEDDPRPARELLDESLCEKKWAAQIGRDDRLELGAGRVAKRGHAVAASGMDERSQTPGLELVGNASDS